MKGQIYATADTTGLLPYGIAPHSGVIMMISELTSTGQCSFCLTVGLRKLGADWMYNESGSFEGQLSAQDPPSVPPPSYALSGTGKKPRTLRNWDRMPPALAAVIFQLPLPSRSTSHSCSTLLPPISPSLQRPQTQTAGKSLQTALKLL